MRCDYSPLTTFLDSFLANRLVFVARAPVTYFVISRVITRHFLARVQPGPWGSEEKKTSEICKFLSHDPVNFDGSALANETTQKFPSERRGEGNIQRFFSFFNLI